MSETTARTRRDATPTTRRRRRRRRAATGFTGPGWLRAALDDAARRVRRARPRRPHPLGLAHWHPIWYSVPLVTVATVTFPIGFLIGIGAFDYWAYYFSGKPTRPEDHSGHGARKWQDYFRPNTDHKVIGVQYLVDDDDRSSCIGGFLAMLFRAELARPGDQYFNPQTFNVLISEHAALMIFAVVVPVFAGLGNFVIPLMIGARRHGVPAPERALLLAAPDRRRRDARRDGHARRRPLRRLDLLRAALLAPAARPDLLQHGRAVGRRKLDPHRAQLPGHDHHDARARDDLLADAAARLGELLHLDARRARDAVHRRLAVLRPLRPRDAHELLRTGRGRLRARLPAHLLVLLPPGGLHHDAARLRDHQRGHLGDEPKADLRLPADGAEPARDPRPRLLGLGAPHVRRRDGAVAARADDGHDAADRGADRDQDLLLGRRRSGTGGSTSRRPMLWAVGFIAMFTIGGLSGIYLGSVPIDIHATDTYFIVAHIHYVLFGGSIFTVFAGIYYWYPKMTGRMYNERLGKLHFWLTFIGFNLTFFPMHYIGLQGMPRRVADYAGRFADFNLFISIASFGLGASTVVFLYNMIWSWKHGPKAGDEPVARDDARVAGQLAAADLQLRRDPAGRRRPVRVRRPRRAPRDPERRHRPRAGAFRRTDGLIHVLVIANETAASPPLLDALRERAAGDDVHVTVIAPVSEPRHGYVVYQDTRRASAGRRLDKTLAAAAAPRSRRRASSSRRARCRRRRMRSQQLEPPPDEIIVSTHPAQRSGWMRRDVVARSRSGRGGLPVRHVVAGDDDPAELETNVLVVANETVISKELLDRVRERAAKGPASFLIVAPQSSDVPSPEAARRLRRALSELRSEGIDAHGQVVHPDPVHRGDGGDARRAGRRDHRLDVPERALGLAAARPDRAAAQRDGPPGRARRLGRGCRMSAHAEPLGHGHAAHHGGNANEHPPPIHYSSRINPVDRRDLPLHRVGDHALRLVLHGVVAMFFFMYS